MRTCFALTAVAIAAASPDAVAQSGCVEWRTVADGLSSTIFAMAELDTGAGPDLYVAGAFSGHVLRLDGDTWASVGSGLNDIVRDLEVYDDGNGLALFAGGQFGSYGGGVARWDGSSWSSLGSGGPAGTVFALAVFDAGNGPCLYAGGSFQTAGGTPAANVARWDGTAWGSVGGGTNSSVRALAVYDALGGPALYAGGFFTSAGGLVANRIARWDGSSWSTMEPAINDGVLSLVGFDDGSGPALYAGGSFTVAGGFLVSNLARWDGVEWTPMGAGADGSVILLETHDDSFGAGERLFASGLFNTLDGVPVNRLASWDGATWETYRGGASGAVRTLGAFDPVGLEGPSFFVAGDFGVIGVGHRSPLSALRIARYGPFVDYNGETFCDASDGSLASCPCGNPGFDDTGCDNAPGTGGVSLTICNQESQPDNRATLVGAGYPAMSGSTSLVIRSTARLVGPLPFGDGLRCIAAPVVRLSATFASGGNSIHPIGHGTSAGVGTFYYQLWFRSLPVTFCEPALAFNLSNGKTLNW